MRRILALVGVVHQAIPKVFNTQHEVLHLVSGQLMFRHNGADVFVRAGETILIKKGSYFEFEKQAYIDKKPCQSVLFFLQTTFIEEFIRQYRVPDYPQTDSQFIKIGSHGLVSNFINSLIPHFWKPVGAES